LTETFLRLASGEERLYSILIFDLAGLPRFGLDGAGVSRQMGASFGGNASSDCDDCPGDAELWDGEEDLSEPRAVVLSGDGGNWHAEFCERC
jgi:hypothetical protein